MTYNILKVSIKRWCQGIALSLLVTMSPIFIGCYGYFPLTKAVYRYNGDITHHKVLRTLIFWGLVIIPVYGTSLLADALVFNLIEFWSGNVLHVNVDTDEDSKISLRPLDDGKGAELVVLRNNEIVSQLKFFKVSDRTFEVYDNNNKLSGMIIQTTEGDLQFTDINGKLIQTIKAEEIKALSQS
jgi:hypothetical protein